MGRDFNNQPDYSDEIAFQIDKEIRRIVDESYDTAEDLLVRNRDLLNKLSAELIEYETVDAKHLKRLIEEYAVGLGAPQGAGTTASGKESPIIAAELKPNTVPHPESTEATHHVRYPDVAT
jgi:cell division protease FtsH